MLDRIAKLVTGGGGLLRAEAQLAAHALKRVLVVTAFMALAMVLATVALVVLAVAGVVMLADAIGWAPAAATVSGGILFVSLAAVFVGKLMMPSALNDSSEQAQQEARQHKRQVREAVDSQPDGPPARGAAPSDGPQSGDWKDRAARFVADHPIEVASGAFAVLAVVGPFRALRLASRGAAIAGVVSSLMQHARDAEGSDADEREQAGTEPDGVGYARAS